MNFWLFVASYLFAAWVGLLSGAYLHHRDLRRAGRLRP